MTLTERQKNVAAVAAIAIVLPQVTSGAMPRLLSGSNALTLTLAASTATAALSLNLLLGYAGQISLGHGAFLAVGAFTSGLLANRADLPIALGLPAAAAVGGGVALCVGIPALRLRGLYLAMATIAFAYAMQQSLLQADFITRGSAGVPLHRDLFPGVDVRDSAAYLTVALVVLIAAWVLDVNITSTKLGRALRALRENETVAESFGIDVARAKLLAFTLSGSVAGMAGAVHGHAIGFVNNETFRFEFSLTLVIIVIVGGVGSRLAVVIAAVAFSLFPEVFPRLGGWEVFIGAVGFMVTVARHPGGVAQLVGFRREGSAAPSATASGPDDIEDRGVLPVLPRPPELAPRPRHAATAMVLEVCDLSVRFGGLHAVDHADLAVYEGKIIGLIGPNGAGKTTLFNAVSGTVPTSTGAVVLEGDRIDRLATHERAGRGLARSFQQIGLAKDLSVFENLLLAQHLLVPYGYGAGLLHRRRVVASEAVLARTANDALEALGFGHYRDAPLRKLSHGQQRIVEIACLLLTDPAVLLLDEPSAGMAPGAAENLAVRLRDLRDEMGRTVLLIEHNIPLVLDVCDEVYVLNAGRILAHGTPDEITENADVVAAYLGATNKVVAALSAGAMLDVVGLHAGFGSQLVLHGVSLSVQPGEIVGVFGLNGAGKSVTMKTVAGVVPARRGTVRFRGRDVTRDSPERRVHQGMCHVPQGRQVFPAFTVEQNLRLGAYRVRRRNRARYRRLLEEVFERFPILAEHRHQLAGTMSGGQQASLAVARALIGDPSLLLVDEPTAGLAPSVIGELFDTVRAVNEGGVSVLLVEQNVTFGLRLVDRAFILQRGRVVYGGGVDQLDPMTVAEYLGVGKLVAAGVGRAIESRRTQGPSIDS